MSSTEPSRGHVRFADRRDAGRRLAERLLPLAVESPGVVALPRGGVPVARQVAELRRRIAAYRDDRAPIELAGRTVIVVDDGVATGLTDMAALRAVRRRKPRRLILAVPVCASESALRLRQHAAQVVCLLSPPRLRGVWEWYRDFSQVSDEQVVAALGGLSDVA